MRSKQRLNETAFDITSHYYRELGYIPLLSVQEELSLAAKIEAGHYAIFSILCNTQLEHYTPKQYGLHLLQEQYAKIRVPLEIIASHSQALTNNKSKTITESYFNYCYRDLYEREPIRIAGRNLVAILHNSQRTLQEELNTADKQIKRDRDYFILANRRLVASMAKRYLNHGLSYLDLNQEGVIGLMTAVDRYDQMKGYKFSTYATWWIRQAMTRAIADQGKTIRLPVHIQELNVKMYRAESKLWQEHHREPTDEEIAEWMDLTVDKILKYRYLKDPIPTSLPVGEDDAELEDFIPGTEASPETQLNLHERRQIIDKQLQKLPPRDEYVLRKRFGLGNVNQDNYDQNDTLERVAEDFNLTRERIRQIENKAVRTLRKRQNLKKLMTET